jgi:glycosidase
MQGWYWDYPKDGCNSYTGVNWAEVLDGKVIELKNAGFTYLWLPPLSRASFGNCSNGYDPKDLYDLGEYSLGRTGFGTRTELDQLITSLNTNGIKAVADVVYNHRDGGKAENNVPLKNYINAYDWTRANTGYNPYPYDRYRVILPIGGATSNGAGDYYFKLSSVSDHNRFNGYQYNIYTQTNKVGWQNLAALSESEPNGGGDCGQANNDIHLGRDLNAFVDDPATCRTDEFHLNLSATDFNSGGDTIFIYLGRRGSDYSDVRVYGIWSGTRGMDIAGEIVYQTYTDFTTMPSGLGSMNYANFKPNSTNATKLDGDWDWPWFFYDYDQNVSSTKTALFDWTKWLWNDVGIRGLRMDAVKHFPPEFVGDLLDHLHGQVSPIDPGLVVGEFYDGNTAALKGWIDQVYSYMDAGTKSSIIPRVFDFSLRSALKDACDNSGYDVRNVFNSSVVDAQSMSGLNVVTFVGNHDFRDAGQYIQNDPILAYAYILTNNQIGLPCIFYPDYYSVSGFPNAGKSQIDALIDVHKQYIYGSSSREYLTRFSTTRLPSFSSGDASKFLVYQLMGIPSGNDVIVAINYDDVAVNMWIGVNMSGVSEGGTLGDRIGNSTLQTLTVSAEELTSSFPREVMQSGLKVKVRYLLSWFLLQAKLKRIMFCLTGKLLQR